MAHERPHIRPAIRVRIHGHDATYYSPIVVSVQPSLKHYFSESALSPSQAMGWYLYDAATAVSFIEHRSDSDELMSAWMEGYRRAGTVAANDERELWTFIMLRRLTLLTWFGSHAGTYTAKQLAPTYGPQSVELAERYLSPVRVSSEDLPALALERPLDCSSIAAWLTAPPAHTPTVNLT